MKSTCMHATSTQGRTGNNINISMAEEKTVKRCVNFLLFSSMFTIWQLLQSSYYNPPPPNHPSVDVNPTDQNTGTLSVVDIYFCNNNNNNRILPSFGLVKLVSQKVDPEEVLAETEIPGGGGRGRLHLTPHCHHQNDSCIKWAVVRAILMFH